MHHDAIIASKTTTQHAPLERLLTHLRIRKVLPHLTHGGVVLDFGCGQHMSALSALNGRADVRIGIDSCFKRSGAVITDDGCRGFGSFSDIEEFLTISKKKVDSILSLACFEHLEAEEFAGALEQLHAISSQACRLIGTLPTPLAKPVLEFLSYKLRLIDPSQIEDHKVYYDRAMLEMALQQSNWKLKDYRTFQFGMNSFFIFEKK
jgi:hypothetical protein